MTSFRSPRALALLLLAATGVRTSAFATPDLPPGEIIAQLACADDAAQSYALYLPTSYGPARAWPIVYGFDPMARGSFVVERFRAAAESRGWIVAVSNNSRNGPPEPSLLAAKAMFRDTQARLSLDRRRVVLAGCSGGGALVLALAGQIDVLGVIVSGAPCEPGQEPRPRSAAVYGTAGIDDFNYHAMRRLHRSLVAAGIPERLVIVEGGHAWLPAGETVDALVWMDVQAMRRGVLARDDALLISTFESRFAAAATMPVPARLLEMRSLTSDFDLLPEASRARAIADALADHREVKAWEKQERTSEARQADETTELLEYAVAGDADEVDARLADLKKSSTQTRNPEAAHVARRVLGGASIGAMESGRAALAAGDARLAARLFGLRTRIDENDPRAFFDLARAHARARARGAALAALTRAHALGYDVDERTREDADFAHLRNEPDFKPLLATPPSPSR